MKFEDIKKLPPEFHPMALELAAMCNQVQRMEETIASILTIVKAINADLTAMDAELDRQIAGTPT